MLDAMPVLTAVWIVALALPAAVSDALRGTIPNWLTLPTLVAAPIVAWCTTGAPAGRSALAGALVCGLVPLVLFRASACGGGDVKLLAALGALAGARSGLEIEMASFVGATLWAFAALARQGRLWGTVGRALALAARPFVPARSHGCADLDRAAMIAVRLGPAVLAACVAALAARSAAWP